MSEVISSAPNSLTPADCELLRFAVAELFSTFRRKYGHRWRDQFEDDKARAVWFASLRHAGISAPMVKKGLADLSKVGTGWPPSDEEFIALCRPPSPSLESAIAEAVVWARDPSHEFSHPAIGAAAREVGTWQIRQLAQVRLRSEFGAAYRSMLDRHARGESLDIPLPKALPQFIHRPCPRGAEEPAHVTRLRAELAESLGLSSS